MECAIHQRGQPFSVKGGKGDSGGVYLEIREPCQVPNPHNTVILFANSPEELIALGCKIVDLGRELRSVPINDPTLAVALHGDEVMEGEF